MKNTLPQYIIKDIRRRSRAAEQCCLANDRITAYCERHGLDSEFVSKNFETLVKYFDPEFFIRDLEQCLQKRNEERSKK